MSSRLGGVQVVANQIRHTHTPSEQNVSEFNKKSIKIEKNISHICQSWQPSNHSRINIMNSMACSCGHSFDYIFRVGRMSPNASFCKYLCISLLAAVWHHPIARIYRTVCIAFWLGHSQRDDLKFLIAWNLLALFHIFAAQLSHWLILGHNYQMNSYDLET